MEIRGFDFQEKIGRPFVDWFSKAKIPLFLLLLLFLSLGLVFWKLARPFQFGGVVVDDYTQEKIEQVKVEKRTFFPFGPKRKETNKDGRFSLGWLLGKTSISFEKKGYEKKSVNVQKKVGKTVFLEISLRPNVLSGKVIDAINGNPLPGAIIKFDNRETKADQEGNYSLDEVNETIQIKVDPLNDQYDPLEITIERKKGADLLVSPMIEVVAEMVSLLWEKGDYEGLYDLLHPDIQGLVTRKVFAEWEKESVDYYKERGISWSFGEILEVSAGGQWKSEATGKTYNDTQVVKKRYLEYQGSVTSDKITSGHFVKAGGFWRWFLDEEQLTSMKY